MLKVTAISFKSGSAGAVAKYYKEHDDKNNIKDVELVHKDALKDNQQSLVSYGEYILAENKDSKDISVFGGELAKKLGIDGKTIDMATSEKLLQGIVGDQQVPPRTDGVRRGGWDFTFSAPKSVSIMALVYGDKRLIEAVKESCIYAMEEVTKRYPEFRIQNTDTKQTENVQAKDTIYGLEIHKASRANDPQLHGHGILYNVGLDENGKARALSLDKFYDEKANKFMGTVFNSHLNKICTTKLGYETESVGNGQFRIVSVPKELEKAFSQRREQVLADAEKYKATDPNTIDKITVFNRPAKDIKTEAQHQALWQERKAGFDGVSLVQQAYEKSNQPHNYQPSIDSNAKESIDLTINHISRYQTRIDHNQVINHAVSKFSVEQNINIADLEKALQNKLNDQELIPLDQKASVLTNHALVEKEQTMIDLAKQQVKGMRVVASDQAINQLPITKQNAQTIQNVLGSSKQTNILELNGTSKDAVSSLIHVAENSGKRINVVTPNSFAMNDLNQHAKRQSFSLFQSIRNHFKGEYCQTLGSFVNNTIPNIF